MATLSVQEWSFIFGLLGNIISFMVFLAPVPTFYKIYKRKSSEGFQSIPYLIALFSASLLLYYAFLKTNALLIVIINAIGCVIELLYLVLYIIYASKKAKIFTVRILLLLNIGFLGLIVVFSLTLAKGAKRVTMVGWICAAINIAVFAAPLSIMRQVIRTKSVEFMPVTLSFFLVLCATTWFLYGFFVKDYYIACPNILGFILAILQMILYFVYKNANKGVGISTPKPPDWATYRKDMKIEGAVADKQEDLEMGKGGRSWTP